MNTSILQQYQQMQPDLNQKTLICLFEVARQKPLINPPYHPLVSVYPLVNLSYIFLLDTVQAATTLVIYSFEEKKEKKVNSLGSIELVGVLEGRIAEWMGVIEAVPGKGGRIALIRVVIGYRTGELILIRYQDKKAKVELRFNRSIKNTQGFFSRASMLFSSNEQPYPTFINEGIRSCVLPSLTSPFFVYLVRNSIIFHPFSQKFQSSLQQFLDQTHFPSFQQQNEPVSLSKGEWRYGWNNKYRWARSSEGGFLQFSQDIAGMVCYLQSHKNMLVVALSSESKLLIFDIQSLSIAKIIEVSAPIRKISSFTCQQDIYLCIMVYGDYALIYNVKFGGFVKISGNRCYVSALNLSQSQNMLLSCSMDHSLSIFYPFPIKKLNPQQISQKQPYTVILNDHKVGSLISTLAFSLGDYDNQERNHIYSYGFASGWPLPGAILFSTYDNKIKIYQIK